jgi:hypothetical protein
MSKRNWNKVADNQFEAMPETFQQDWEELRQKTN